MSLAEVLDLSSKVVTTRDPALYLDQIWQTYFADVPRLNQVEIAYGYPWKRRLGLIRLALDNTRSFIGLNALLQLAQVPEYILITTVAHELTHYAHGFGSPLPRLYEHPHANNVIQDELERRGLGDTMRLCDAWIDRYWFAFYERERENCWSGIPNIRRSTRSQSKPRP